VEIDNQSIVCRFGSKGVKQIRVRTGEELFYLCGATVSYDAFVKVGNTMIITATKFNVKLWDLTCDKGAKCVQTYEPPLQAKWGKLICMVLAKDSSKVLVGFRRSLQLRSINDLRLIRSYEFDLTLQNERINCVCQLSDGTVVAGTKFALYAWRENQNHDNGSDSVPIVLEKRDFFNRVVQLVGFKNMKMASIYDNHDNHRTGAVTLWDMTLGERLRDLRFDDHVSALVEVADGLMAIGFSHHTCIQVWDYETGVNVLWVYTDLRVTCMRVLSNGYLAVGYEGKRGDATIKIHPTWKLSVLPLRFHHLP